MKLVMVKDGSSIDITDRVTSIDISNATDNGSRLLGNAICSMLELELNNFDGSLKGCASCTFLYGPDETAAKEFNVQEAPSKYTGRLKLTLYDGMIKLNKAYASTLTYSTTSNPTIAQQIAEISTISGVPIDSSTLMESVTSMAAAWIDTTIIMRNYIGWIAELSGKNCYINDSNVLTFENLASIDHAVNVASNFDISDDTITISRVAYDDGVTLLQKGDDTGKTLYIDADNSYCTQQSIIDAIYDIYNGLSFHALDNLKTIGLSNFRIGHTVTYDSLKCIALSIKQSFQGTNSLFTISGEVDIKNTDSVISKENTEVRIKRVQTKIDQVNNSLEIVAQDTDKNKNDIASLKLTTDEISSTVSKNNSDITSLNDQIKTVKTLNVLLTNGNCTVATDQDGNNGDYTNATTDIQVFYGSTDVTSSTTVTVDSVSNVTGTMNDKTYHVTAMSADNGYAELKASYTPADTITPITATVRFTLSKSRSGTSGAAGVNAELVTISADGQVFKRTSSSAAYSPATITLKPSFQNCSFGKWQMFDGSAWADVTSTTVSTTDPYLSGNNLVVPSGISGTNKSFKCLESGGTYYDVVSVIKVSDGDKGADGTSISNVVNYYLATSAASGVTTSTSGWTTAVQNVSADKKYLWNYEVVNYSNGQSSTGSPCIIGAYGDAGTAGNGISSITAEYYVSTSKTTQSGGSWSTTAPTWAVNTYLWIRNHITYTNGGSGYTTPWCDSSWEAVNQVQVGGRNLASDSKKNWTSTGYNIIQGAMATPWIIGETYSISLKGSIDSNGTFGLWADGGYCRLGYLSLKGNNIYSLEGVTCNGSNDTTKFSLCNTPGSAAHGTAGYSATVEWIKIEIGNKATDWTPAPEDVDDSIANTAKNASSDLSKYQQIVSTTYSTIQQTTDQIAATVSKITDLTKADGTIDTRIKTATTALGVDKISSTLSTVEEIANGTKAKLDNTISFDSNGDLVLAKSLNGSNAAKLVMSTSTIKFENSNGETPLELDSDGNAKLMNAEIETNKQFRLGLFAFTPRDNGSLDFGKVKS